MSIRSLVTWVGAAVGLMALGFVLSRLVHQLHEIPSIHWTFLALSSLAGAVLLSGLPVAIAAVTMSLLLGSGGVSLSWRESFALVGRSQIGKYLPGNVFHYLGRVALGVRRGLPVGPLSLAVGAETAFTIGVAVTIAGVGRLLDGGLADLRFETFENTLIWIAGGLGILVLLSLIAALFRRRTTEFLREFRTHYSLRTMLTAAALYSLTFVLLGLVIEVLVQGVLRVESPWSWLQFTWRFALIWVLGLATIGAPAGLGVREALLLVWLSPTLGESVALGLAGLLRLVTTTADIVVFGLAWLLDGRIKRSEAQSPTRVCSTPSHS